MNGDFGPRPAPLGIVAALCLTAGSHAGNIDFRAYLMVDAPDDNGNAIYELDTPITGTGHFVTPGLGPFAIDGDFSLTGELYVSLYTSGLGKVNLSTGALEIIGPWGGSFRMACVAFAPDGSLYGVAGDQKLYRIDPLTGAASVAATSSEIVVGIDFGPDGTCYAAVRGRIALYDVATGMVGATVATGTPLGGAPIDFGPDGIIRMITTQSNVLEIDPVAHTVSPPIPVGVNPTFGIATVPVPAPGALVLAGLAPLAARRRRRA